MSIVSVILSTAKIENFVWYNGYEGIEVDQLEDLLFETRITLDSLSAELHSRKQGVDTSSQKRRDRDIGTSPTRYEDLTDVARSINHELSASIIRSIEQADGYLQALRHPRLSAPISTTPIFSATENPKISTSKMKASKAYLDLLRVVLQHAGPAVMLLVICVWKPYQVLVLSPHDRIRLAQWTIQNQESLHCPDLQRKADELGFRRIRFGSQDLVSIKPVSNGSVNDSNKRFHKAQHAVIPSNPEGSYLGEDLDRRVLPYSPRSVNINNHQSHLTSQPLPLSYDQVTLLNLIGYLDVFGVPEITFVRAAQPCKVWGSSGAIEEIRPQDAGFNDNVSSLIATPNNISLALVHLKQMGLVVTRPASSMILSPVARSRIDLANPLSWMVQALILICHSFPSDQDLEPLYGSVGRQQIRQVKHVVQSYDELNRLGCLSKCLKHRVAATLLAASRFLDETWKLEALRRVKEILSRDPDRYLQTWVRLRESFLHKPVIDARTNALHGGLIVSEARRLVRIGQLDCALAVIKSFSPIKKEPSRMETVVLLRINVLRGKINCFLGQYHQALECLKDVPDCPMLYGHDSHVRTSFLAHAYCETNRPQMAESILRTELGDMEAQGWQELSRYSRLRLFLAETLLVQGRNEEARGMYFSLEKVYNTTSTGFAIQLGQLRVKIGIARVSHLTSDPFNAIRRWGQAMEAVTNSELPQGFIRMVIHYSIAHAQFELGQFEEAMIERKRADELFEQEGRQHWHISLGSTWLDYVMRTPRGSTFFNQSHTDDRDLITSTNPVRPSKKPRAN